MNSTNLIVNHLPPNMTDKEFKDLFETIGRVRTAKIIRHRITNVSYGYGFINFFNEADAAEAVHNKNGCELLYKDQPLRRYLQISYARPSCKEIQNANLFISGIPKKMTDEEFKHLFAAYGQIINCRLLKEKTTGKNTGIGFVLYNMHNQAEEAIKKLHGKKISNDYLNVRYAKDNYQRVREESDGDSASVSPGGSHNVESSTLFVYNIGPDTDEKSLYGLFSRYGRVIKVNVIRNAATGTGKGYGFVTMPNYNEATLAISSLNGVKIFEKPLQVSFKATK